MVRDEKMRILVATFEKPNNKGKLITTSTDPSETVELKDENGNSLGKLMPSTDEFIAWAVDKVKQGELYEVRIQRTET
jgi:hypothetical protein